MTEANTRKRKGVSPRARGRRSSFRDEVTALHEEIFRRNQERINASVHGYSAAFRRYEREYARGVRAYTRRSTPAALTERVRRCDALYVGDYHTLPQARRSFLRLLRRLPEDRSVTIALELVEGKHQDAIDAYMAGSIDDATFLRDTHHETHWLFGSWASFKDIFDLARLRGWRIIGIDSAGRGGRGSSLAQRDGYAARRIAEVWAERPDDLVATLIGELHVSPGHLPREVERACARAGLPTPDKLVVYQNCEKIYGALQKRGLEHEVDVVQVERDTFCLINTPPIVCQQSFLNWLYSDEDGEQLEEPEQTFREYVRLIASFFDLPVGDAVDEVELTTIVDLSFLQRLRRRGDFSTHDMAIIKRQILRSESYYIPRAKMVYLGNLSVNHVSEEATHFLRHVCADATDPKLLVDAFYARCLEEALGFLGSKIINHKRKCASPAYFRRVLKARGASTEDKRLARLVLRHVHMENGERVRGMAEVYQCDADMFNAITHVLGYQLGDKLYYGLLGGQLSKQEIRELFFDSLEEEGTALTTYLYLKMRTDDVDVPQRM